MTTVIAPICLECTRYHRDDRTQFCCDAYPDGIPTAIVESRADHTKPLPGDHDLQFEPLYPGKVGDYTGNPLLTGREVWEKPDEGGEG
jgi:hypothetical protein